MQKTKLGISVGLLGAAIYLTGLFGGFFASVILTGYVLLFEENEWLRKNAVKAVTLMVFFSILVTVLNLIPNVIGCISNVVAIFSKTFEISILTYLVNALISAMGIVEKILFIGLGMKALNQGTISVPVVDRVISKYMA